jgi:uncharacterized integral membrane protein (TIGR00697 family)
MAPEAEKLHPIEASHLQARRERVFLIFAGIFLGTLAMLNILGISRFIKLFEFETAGGFPLVFAIAVGVLPYPITFLCTDFISEFYGRRRANFVVFVGVLLNIWVVIIMWLGGVLPGFEAADPATGAIVRDAAGRLPVFFEIRALTFGAVTASMIAYMAAQFCDVWVFHFWKRVTKGRLLWVRNTAASSPSSYLPATPSSSWSPPLTPFPFTSECITSNGTCKSIRSESMICTTMIHLSRARGLRPEAW